jgi:lysyl-tRNA synthetase class 2
MNDWCPSAGRDALALRAALNRLIREFFHARGVLEVETPVLSAAGNTDPNIESLCAAAASGAGARTWLRTSPEYALKRLLAGGVGDCYELGRVFRAGETGRRHNPEFTLLEWYRIGWNHERLMAEVAELVEAALALVGRRAQVRRSSYRDLFRTQLGLDPMLAPVEALRTALGDVAIDPAGLTREDWLDLLLTHRIEPTFPADQLLLLFDFPAARAALARIRHDAVPVAERFELYLGPLELANGYHELCDAVEQRARFERDLSLRRERAAAQPPIDQRLLAALAAGLPACAGVALGVDRLLMAMLGSNQIDAVLAFPRGRA